MSLRNIREMGDPVLEKRAKEITEVTPRIRALAADMLETMYDAGGVGLAAPQVGILRRIVVIDVTEEQDEPYTMLNPEIIEQDGEQTGYEGCLSVPGYQGRVIRPEKIHIKGLDYNGEEQEYIFEGWYANVMCHEFDHLEGVLYIDKADNIQKLED